MSRKINAPNFGKFWNSTVPSCVTPECHKKIKTARRRKSRDFNNSSHLVFDDRKVSHKASRSRPYLSQGMRIYQSQQKSNLQQVFKLHGRPRQKHTFIFLRPPSCCSNTNACFYLTGTCIVTVPQSLRTTLVSLNCAITFVSYGNGYRYVYHKHH